MEKFAFGVLAGGMLAAIGTGMLMNDRQMRRRIIRGGRKMANKAGQVICGKS